MADALIQYDEPVPDRRPFQYSLRTLFIITTVLAILCAGLFAAPGWIRILVLLFWLIAYPITIISLIVYGRDYLRTFSIGALIGIVPICICQIVALGYYSVSFLFIVPLDEISWMQYFQPLERVGYYLPGIMAFATFFLSMLGGVVMLGSRWLIESYRRQNG